MDWSNERYVRIYTRKTVRYLLYPWQSRAIRDLIFKELDRAGILEIGNVDPIEAIAVAISMPVEVVSVGLPPLLEDGTLEHRCDCIVSPNYLEAQEAKQTDAARQRRSRELRRDTKRAQTVTICDNQSQCVTEPSHDVTSSHMMSLQPSQPSLTRSNSSESNDIRRVFDEWVSVFWSGKGRKPILDSKRKGKIKARLKEGFTHSELVLAIRGCAKSDFHITNGYTKIETILRDAGTVENHIERIQPNRRLASTAEPRPQEVIDAERILQYGTPGQLANGERERLEAIIEKWNRRNENPTS